MPNISLAYQHGGPLIQVSVGLSKPHTDALIASNQLVPPWVTGTFLIDTGASGTCVDPDLVKPLGLAPSGAVMMQTPSTGATPHQCFQYDVMLYIPPAKPGELGHFVEALPVLETHLRPQGIDGLLGRDVLQSCVFIMNGPLGIATLSF